MSIKHIPSLNGLRALSIFFVLISHIQSRNFHRLDSPGGQIGVNIFFVISGFLITYLLIEEEKQGGTISLKNFYIRRTLRIFPVYYSLLFVYFILSIFGVFHFHTNSWITSLTYTKYFAIPNAVEWETGHLWSLSIEEHFYLFWPFVFSYFKTQRAKIAVGIILIIPVFRALYFIENNEIYGEMTILQRADALMMGCFLALNRERISNSVFLILNKYKYAIYLPLLGILFSIGMKRLLPIDSPGAGALVRAIGGSTGMLTNTCIGLVILVSIEFQNNLWYRFLNARIMNYVGKLSYSLYIWQQLFFSEHVAPLSNLPINLFCIVIAAITSYEVIEKPFLKLKARFETKNAGFQEIESRR